MKPPNATPVRSPGIQETTMLLEQAHLIGEDVTEAMLSTFFGIYENELLVAVGGIEPAPPFALLRSFATTPAYQGRGHAGTILEAVESLAREMEITHIYLLTETAETYFARKGYVTTPRNDAPECITSTAQFKGLCPASAAFMSKDISS